MGRSDTVQVVDVEVRDGVVPRPDPRRADPDRLQRDIDAVSRSPVVEALLAAANTALLVLDEHRQIVALNGRGLPAGERADALGMRLGEAFHCVHAIAAGDCGVSDACAACGALGAVLGCRRQDHPVDAECLIRSGGGAALQFDVRATPVSIGSGRFVVVSLRDVSGEKRRQALEQVFFHDVLNTVTGLRGWSELLRLANGCHPEAPGRIERLSRQLEREIRDHRALVLAEDGKLVPRPERVLPAQVLREVEDVFASHVAARGRRLERSAADLELETDPALLQRILVNMVRNAFEATEPGGTVRLRCEPIAVAVPAAASAAGLAGLVRFSVHNEGTIPPDVQARVFQRSFSTKAQHGRGFGTYGMKLLGEGYLGGKVSFVSDAAGGTEFRLDLPLATAERMAIVTC